MPHNSALHQDAPTHRPVCDIRVRASDFTRYFTEDVIATFEGTDQRADGREAAGQLIRYVHEDAFDARPELKNLLVRWPRTFTGSADTPR